MKWEAQDLMGINKDYLSPYERLRKEELLGMAYLKSCHDHVISNGFSYIASFDGRHRSGKSVTAITFAYLWDYSFWDNFEKRIVQDHNEFIEAISSIAKNKIKGGCVIVDEAGISLSASDWYEKWMKTVTQMVQMFGMWCPVVLFVAPVKDFVDSRLRKMFHAYYKVTRTNKVCTYVTPYRVKFNSVLGKFFYKKPVMHVDGEKITIKRLQLGVPPDFILERYQNMEQVRKEDIFKNLIDDLKKSETISKRKKQIDIDEVIKDVLNEYRIFESKNSKSTNIILDATKIRFNKRITNSEASYVKSEVEGILNKKILEKVEK